MSPSRAPILCALTPFALRSACCSFAFAATKKNRKAASSFRNSGRSIPVGLGNQTTTGFEIWPRLRFSLETGSLAFSSPSPSSPLLSIHPRCTYLTHPLLILERRSTLSPPSPADARLPLSRSAHAGLLSLSSLLLPLLQASLPELPDGLFPSHSWCPRPGRRRQRCRC